MLRTALARIVGRLRSRERDGDGTGDDADVDTAGPDGSAESESGSGNRGDESRGSRFVPSVLDWSVRYGHGGADAEADRELARVSDEADRLSRTREK
ncbi:hypothetical protein [Halobellus rubicundus]|uniref:Uncharacterized protein n=1 Tax=Halobellus rubicundus TaxID=2996466 RepID=A0ABD5MIT9_9EURY